MFLIALAIFALLMALIPAGMIARNLLLFAVAPAPTAERPAPAISMLIPARNEEANIERCVGAALANRGVELEVVVLDDQSTDGTANIVRSIAESDPRLRLETAPALPAGWCGKQHACHVLAGLARHELLLFLDADVRLTPDAASRAIAFLQVSKAALVSGFPRQETGSFFEALVLPLIHFVLLGFLPLDRMRASTSPAYGAGCGQFFLTRREDYRKVGASERRGHFSEHVLANLSSAPVKEDMVNKVTTPDSLVGAHALIRGSLHDGIMLPRAYRRAGLATDLFDATDLAVCRMYHGTRQTWRGLAKNATEGMASPAAIVPWTIILFTGQILPWVLVFHGGVAGMTGVAGALTGFGARLLLSSHLKARAQAGIAPPTPVLRLAEEPDLAAKHPALRQASEPAPGGINSWIAPFLSALLHPLGIAALLAIQWYALARKVAARPAEWRGRSYAPAGDATPSPLAG